MHMLEQRYLLEVFKIYNFFEYWTWTFTMQLCIKAVFIVQLLSTKVLLSTVSLLPTAFNSIYENLQWIKPWGYNKATSNKRSEHAVWNKEQKYDKCYLFFFVFRIILCCWLYWFTLGKKKDYIVILKRLNNFKIHEHTYDTGSLQITKKVEPFWTDFFTPHAIYSRVTSRCVFMLCYFGYICDIIFLPSQSTGKTASSCRGDEIAVRAAAGSRERRFTAR